MIGGSETAAHTAQNMAQNPDDGSTPIILVMVGFFVLAGGLIWVSPFTVFGSLVITTITVSLSALTWRIIRAARLMILHHAQMDHYEKVLAQTQSNPSDPTNTNSPLN